MQTRLPGGVITDDWEHLVRDYRYVEKLEKAGVQLKEAAEAADVVGAAIQAKKNGATAENVTNSIALQQAIKEELSGSSDGLPNTEQITISHPRGPACSESRGKDGRKRQARLAAHHNAQRSRRALLRYGQRGPVR